MVHKVPIGRPKEKTKNIKAACLPIIRSYDGRHTAAISALQAGVAIHVIKGRVGRANASTTLDVYAHFLPSADKLAADSAGSVLDHATSEGGNRLRTD